MLLNLLYLLALAALSPWLAWRAARTGRYRRDLAAKLLGRAHVANPTRKPVAWFHAVSVGEINLLGTLVPAFQKRHPGWHVVVSSTTDTGLSEARKRFSDLDVIAWPFDFTWAVGAALDAVNPSLVVLTESELWPNFLAAAGARAVPVVVVNARMSPRSFARLRRVAGLARRVLFRHVTRFAVQETDYADRLRQLGVPDAKLVVTGSIKYDGALKSRETPATNSLRELLGLTGRAPSEPGACRGPTPPGPPSLQGGGEFDDVAVCAPSSPSDSKSRLSPPPCREGGSRDAHEAACGRFAPLVLLAGSTHAPEEAIVLDVFARLRVRFSDLRLVLVPRHPDRFAEVAKLLEGSGLPFVRRSQVTAPLPEMPAVVLLDTVGELGAAWGLADVGFTGGSLDGARGGQSMIEPAGYGVPAVFGPHVWNFRAAARRLVEVGGAAQVRDAAELDAALAHLLSDAEARERMGAAARALVERQQGATARTLDVLDSVISTTALARAA